MAIVLAKLFIRSISQPFDHTQTGISLWTIEDIEAKVAKEEAETRRLVEATGGEPKKDEREAMVVDEDQYDDMGVDEDALVAMDLS
jgi:DNA excision repair protein ERCC-2